jgi:transposase InsO family protein
MILGLLDEAVTAGARQSQACAILELPARTVQRWRTQGIGEDRRTGLRRPPANKLSVLEERRILELVTAPEYRDLSPQQLVPILADDGTYLASESTIYRLLRRQDMQQPRETSRAPQTRHRPDEHCALCPNQVWSWDITYLRGPIVGAFYYLYMVEDVFSRKIVGWAVHETECNEHAARLLEESCAREGIARDRLVLHSDNGSPMKGATILATLQRLGVVTSFSRPRVSDDNPYSESLFRTLKYRPEYPGRGFASLDDARAWVCAFVRWYNTEHRHSAIRFVTPEQRHSGQDKDLLSERHQVYEAARRRHPDRWSRATRNWSPIEQVVLNPAPHDSRMKKAG